MNEYVKSALITFFAAAAIYLVPQIDQITMESMKNGTLVGILFVAVRTGLKAVLELGIAMYQQPR